MRPAVWSGAKAYQACKCLFRHPLLQQLQRRCLLRRQDCQPERQQHQGQLPHSWQPHHLPQLRVRIPDPPSSVLHIQLGMQAICLLCSHTRFYASSSACYEVCILQGALQQVLNQLILVSQCLSCGRLAGFTNATPAPACDPITSHSQFHVELQHEHVSNQPEGNLKATMCTALSWRREALSE